MTLPTNKVSSASVKIGIPAESIPLEPRSVLRNKSVINALTDVGVKARETGRAREAGDTRESSGDARASPTAATRSSSKTSTTGHSSVM